jgi:hypothetical protein
MSGGYEAILFPDPERQTFLLQECMAAWAMSRMFPSLDEMFRHRRTGQFHLLPFKLARFSGLRSKQTFAQNHRRNLRPHERGKFPGKFLAPHHLAHAGKNVEQFPALTAEDGLHIAIQTAVRAAGKPGAILALRAVKMKRLAHAIKSRWNW